MQKETKAVENDIQYWTSEKTIIIFYLYLSILLFIEWTDLLINCSWQGLELKFRAPSGTAMGQSQHAFRTVSPMSYPHRSGTSEAAAEKGWGWDRALSGSALWWMPASLSSWCSWIYFSASLCATGLFPGCTIERLELSFRTT